MNLPEALRHFYELLSRGLLAGAEEFLQTAPARWPEPAHWCEARANLLELCGRSREAEQLFREAARSGQVSWHSGLARSLQNQRRWQESLDHYRRAEALAPGSAASWLRLAQAEVLLSAGCWAEGWQAYEARFEVEGLTRQQYFQRCLSDYSPPFPWRGQPEWNGEDYAGKTLLIWKEQGDGDCFQYLRFLRLARERGSRLLFACPCSLVNLLQGVSGADLVSQKLPAHLPDLEYDYHLPLLSLPRVLGITVNSLPPPDCLKICPHSQRIWRERLQSPYLKVGLVWAGQRLSQPERRSLALAALAPLSQVPRVQFYSLQKGPDAIQAQWPPPGLEVRDLSPWLHDWSETAAALRQLDLLISIDTGVAHLAGVLGCPTWLLLPAQADWRWTETGESSRWYPHHRLVGQDQIGTLAEDLWRRSTVN